MQDDVQAYKWLYIAGTPNGRAPVAKDMTVGADCRRLNVSQRNGWTFDKEVERLFSGLRFMPVGELLPYVAEQLEGFSQILLKQQNHAEAEAIK
jgi:hypothetical protein